MKRVQTTCPYCGTGCNIDLLVENSRIVRAEPTKNHPVNDGELCLKGWYGWEYVHSPDRLRKPLIRKENGKLSKNGELVESTWEEALNLIVSKIRDTKEKYGPDALMGFSSARCVNEDNMGALPSSLLGNKPAADKEVRKHFEKLWNCKIPSKPGAKVTDVPHKMENKTIDSKEKRAVASLVKYIREEG